MPILSPQDHDFFHENGYVIVPDAVPQSNLDATIDAIWAFLEMDRHNPDDWYRPPHHPSSMIEMYQHQALWDNRQHSRVHQAFSEILVNEKLWVSFDRVSMKPPSNPKYPAYENKGFIHWDLDTNNLPQTLRVQGVLCLSDTDESMGGFRCIPGFHNDLEEWIKTQSSDRNPRSPDLSALPPGRSVQPIPGKAGDLIIWNTRLAHGNGHNVSSRPRLAQYISMFPAPQNEEFRQRRIEQWEHRKTPQTNWVQGDPRHWEETHGTTAQLTPLGRKLLGLDAW